MDQHSTNLFLVCSRRHASSGSLAGPNLSFKILDLEGLGDSVSEVDILYPVVVRDNSIQIGRSMSPPEEVSESTSNVGSCSNPHKFVM